jgi:hypothetical protein
MGLIASLDVVVNRKIPFLPLPEIKSHSCSPQGYPGCIYKWYFLGTVYLYCIMYIELQSEHGNKLELIMLCDL